MRLNYLGAIFVYLLGTDPSGIMATNGKIQNEDLLGMKRFALVESAQDLLNRVQGAYGRLAFEESRSTEPNVEKINQWKQRSQIVGRQYWLLDWNNMSKVDQFIIELGKEWQTISHPAYNQTTRFVHAG